MQQNIRATGNGPFEFTNSQGKQISIPLSAIKFDSNGQPVVNSTWKSYVTTQPGQALLAYAVKEGLLAPQPQPSPFPAMVIGAADPGSCGNNITVAVTISGVTTSPPSNDPTLTPFSLMVTETDTYTNQTASTIASTLASSGGLVQIVGPVNQGVPAHQSGTLGGSPPQYSVLGSGSPPGWVFKLGAKHNVPDASRTQVSVTPNLTSPPDPGAGTFTLTVTWPKTVNGITLPTLESMIQSQLSYEITVSKPSSGAYSLPAAGSTTLAGGGTASTASAILYTSL